MSNEHPTPRLSLNVDIERAFPSARRSPAPVEASPHDPGDKRLAVQVIRAGAELLLWGIAAGSAVALAAMVGAAIARGAP